MAKDIKEFKLEALKDLYIKLTRDALVYAKIDNKTPVLWQGWQAKKGQVVGKLYQFINSKDYNNIAFGLWAEMYTNDGRAYYIRIDPKTIDWSYIQSQMDERRRYSMAWYALIWEDIETAVSDFYDQNLKLPITYIAIGGGILLLGWLYFNTVGKYQIYSNLATKAIKDLKEDGKKQ
jgi:hypothetical protein